MKNSELLDNYAKLIEIDDITNDSIFGVSFNDHNMELKYNVFLLNFSRKMRITVNIVSLLLIFMRISLSLRGRLLPSFLYADIATGILAIVLFICSHFLFRKKMKLRMIFNYVFSGYILLVNAYSTIFSHIYFKSTPENDKHNGIQLRDLYVMLLLSITELLYSLEYNFFFCDIYFFCEYRLDNILHDKKIRNR